jgi:hypothetical protein
MYSLPEIWSFPYERGYGGCRSWVKLPAEGEAKEQVALQRPVISDDTWEDAANTVRGMLGA